MSGFQPRPINHGTAGGYAAHRRRGVPQCQDCIDAHTSAGKARDYRTGRRRPFVASRIITIPTTVLADLYLNAAPDAQARAEAAITTAVLDRAVQRYDQENQ